MVNTVQRGRLFVSSTVYRTEFMYFSQQKILIKTDNSKKRNITEEIEQVDESKIEEVDYIITKGKIEKVPERDGVIAELINRKKRLHEK